MITADRDLVPDDPHAYREALIDAFRRRSIFPQSVENLSEDALIWRPARRRIDSIPGLNFANLRFRGDPQNAAGAAELRRQARCLGDVICRPDLASGSSFWFLQRTELADASTRNCRAYSQSAPAGESGRMVKWFLIWWRKSHSARMYGIAIETMPFWAARRYYILVRCVT